MSYTWNRESPAVWNEDKQRIIGAASTGIFDSRFSKLHTGDHLPAEWFCAKEDHSVVGYGWLDVVWGDAEILLAVHPNAQGKGVGEFILGKLEEEARKRGLHYLYNQVRPTHPDKDKVTEWLTDHGFKASEDARLLRAVVPPDA